MTRYESITMPDASTQEIRELHRLLSLGTPVLVGKNGTERVELPDVIYRILKEAVNNMRSGKAVLLMPEDANITTQMAANALGVSRPHLIKLLESGEIPYSKTGSHRRIRLVDLHNYEKKRAGIRREAIGNLARTAIREGYYEGLPIPEGGDDE